MMLGGWIRILSAALAAWCAAAGVAHAAPRRIVWRGTERLEDAYHNGGRISPVSGTPVDYFHLIVVYFTYIEEVDDNGSSRFVSRRVTWTAKGKSVTPGYETVTCEGSGGGELLGASDAATREMLRIPCTVSTEGNFFAFFLRPPTSIKPPDLVPVDKLRDNCSYSEETLGRRYSVWLSPDVEAVMDVDTARGGAYASFAPEPGRTIELKVHTVPAFPARFRFEIDRERTSHFSGYAGNALIDDAFFKRYRLEHLAQDYHDDSPDLIFDPANFDERSWSVHRQDQVETASDSGGATALITAMDYGAIGKIRAFVKYKCGGWAPVQITVGNARVDMVSVPMDQNNNLIADVLEAEEGSAERDEDWQPAGDGTKGDGLTAFEEYRGFMTAGTDCDKGPLTDAHQRTTPWKKDLFVAGDAPLPWLAHKYFASASDLNVIELCDRHLWDLDSVKEAIDGFNLNTQDFLSVPPETRVVNFTLARAQQTSFEGHTIHKGPQHGVYLAYDHLRSVIPGQKGFAIPTEPGVMGPPKFTAAVVITLDFTWDMLSGADKFETMAMMNIVIAHELGHAVGIPHHSDSRQGQKVIIGVLDVTRGLSPLQSAGVDIGSPEAAALPPSDLDALLIEPGTGCHEGDQDTVYRGGVFAGCLAIAIVRQGQQESGNVSCPMRYWITDFFEPPGVHAQYRWTDTVTDSPKPGKDTKSWVVDAWGGGVLRWTLNPPSPIRRLGRFCNSTAGTEENARKDYWNLAGNAGRAEPCDRLIVVNDLAGK